MLLRLCGNYVHLVIRWFHSDLRYYKSQNYFSQYDNRLKKYFWQQKAVLGETFTHTPQKNLDSGFWKCYHRQIAHILIHSQIFSYFHILSQLLEHFLNFLHTFSYFLSFGHIFSTFCSPFDILSQPLVYFPILLQLFANGLSFWHIFATLNART